MKEIINIKDRYKMLIIYFITTIISMSIAGFLVEYDYIQSCLRNYLWPLITFTISFLILIRLFKVNFKSVLIFLGIIIFLLLFILLNLDFFALGSGNTPDGGIFPRMTFIALYTTLPFQAVIKVLDGYDIYKFSYIMVPIYMLSLIFLSYITLKFKVKKQSK